MATALCKSSFSLVTNIPAAVCLKAGADATSAALTNNPGLDAAASAGHLLLRSAAGTHKHLLEHRVPLLGNPPAGYLPFQSSVSTANKGIGPKTK